MPIISSIGRRHPKVRALHFGIYLVLILGSLTMIYPFMIMIAGSMKSSVDIRGMEPVPRFLFDDLMLYRKHIEGLFNEHLDAMKIAYDIDCSSFEVVEPPSAPSAELVDDWLDFLENNKIPPYTYALGYTRTPISRTLPLMERRFKQELLARFDGDISAMNHSLGTEFAGWNAFYVTPDNFLPRRSKLINTPFYNAYKEFKQRQPLGYRYYFSVEGFFKILFLKTQYTGDIAYYNKEHGTSYSSYDDIELSIQLPDGTDEEKADWETFVRHTLNLLWLRVDSQAAPIYRKFLKAKYQHIETLNNNYGTAYKRFGDIPLIDKPPDAGLRFSDWAAFITGWKDPDTGRLYSPRAEYLQIHSIERMFRSALESEYENVETLNRKCGGDFAQFGEIQPPQRDAHYLAFLKERRALKSEFVTRNYKAVFDYIVLHGRGILNTVIYCTLAVLAALLVNPLAAYAMSRYRMPNAYKILLFMLVTMAFPPMVTQIPVFLMLRDLKLLNTFAALVLPTLAYGYSIFLLKGFFDSLPRELYESAQIDGAREWTLFWQITMTLSKPILAVIALQAFTMAYSNFMFALLICQDEKMWTLMVWLYQLQQRSGQAVMYASLIIAAVPTFIVFVLCQNVIMRGIVVPVEK